MKKYLLTLTLIASSIGVTNLAHALDSCNCQVNEPQKPCDQTQPRTLGFGLPLASNACIWNCHCAPNMYCMGGGEGPNTSTVGECRPRT